MKNNFLPQKPVLNLSIIGGILLIVILVFFLSDKQNVNSDLGIVEEAQSREDICNNIEGIQSNVPDQMYSDESGNCIVVDRVEESSFKRDTVQSAPVGIVQNNPVVTEDSNFFDTSNESEVDVETEEIVVNPQEEGQESSYSPVESDGTLDLGQYQRLTISEYYKNPKAYEYEAIKLKDTKIAAFYPNNNSIVIIDKNDYSSNPDFINVFISNDEEYSKIVKELEQWDAALIFGIGLPDREFNIIGDGAPYDEYQRAFQLDGIYSCNNQCTNHYDIGVNKVFEKEF